MFNTRDIGGGDAGGPWKYSNGAKALFGWRVGAGTQVNWGSNCKGVVLQQEVHAVATPPVEHYMTSALSC